LTDHDPMLDDSPAACNSIVAGNKKLLRKITRSSCRFSTRNCRALYVVLENKLTLRCVMTMGRKTNKQTKMSFCLYSLMSIIPVQLLIFFHRDWWRPGNSTTCDKN